MTAAVSIKNLDAPNLKLGPCDAVKIDPTKESGTGEMQDKAKIALAELIAKLNANTGRSRAEALQSSGGRMHVARTANSLSMSPAALRSTSGAPRLSSMISIDKGRKKMSANGHEIETRVAVLVDCDNTTPEILEYALRVVAQFGRVVLRRGYGNTNTLANKWQEALVRLAFTPCLQFQYASGKNTADIALALDAMEAMFDGRADTFCLVTSDSDFAYLCRKLRERGATVHIVGEAKTPDALRNASDQFFEWQKTVPAAVAPIAAAEPAPEKSVSKTSVVKSEPARPEGGKPIPKLRPRFVIEAVNMLTADTPEGKVALGPLGSYLKRTDPAFSPQTYGHSGLLDMIKTYDLLVAQQEPGGHWSVRLAPNDNGGHVPDAAVAADNGN